MTIETGSRLVVKFVHRVSGRPWILVSGALEGAPLLIGDPVVVETADGPGVRTTIETIELHGPPGLITVALPERLADIVTVGSVISTPR